ncbi:MAG: 4-hydroxybutyrate--acetyl-CoA CoA transferase [Lachnospiraceae bacterium]|nr:4-hydroxybutyrate--acetyl-CoA CoA transferase [Lachnospiraceae bacterium]
MGYSELHSQKIARPEEALNLVHSGMNIILAGDGNCPHIFAKSLSAVTERVIGVKVFKDHTNAMDFVNDPRSAGHIESIGFFYGKDFIEGMNYGTCSYFPTDLCNYASFIIHHYKPDLFVTAATQMDDEGNFHISLCDMWEGEILEFCIENGVPVIVEENANLPYVTGAPKINIEKVAAVIEAGYKPGEIKGVVPSEDEIKVAQNVRSLLRDGDCVQFGIGSLPDAIAAQCMDLRDLGLHTEMITTALGKMIREGVITGERKNLHKGEHIFTFAGGDEALYRTLGENPRCRIVPGSYGVNPRIIMQNDNMVSVNTLIEMDMTGQVCSESIGPKQYSGSGGGMDYAYGALMSRGGRGIMAFTSVTKKGYSKIKPMLTPGAAVTVPRNYVDYIVTEYGIAPMRGRTVKERVNNLIAAAHPDFREELRFAAKKHLYI